MTVSLTSVVLAYMTVGLVLSLPVYRASPVPHRVRARHGRIAAGLLVVAATLIFSVLWLPGTMISMLRRRT